MKHHGRIILLIVGAACIAVAAYFIFLPRPYSSEQTDIISILGKPDQFVIMYLPRGEKELIRSEVWLYPEAGKRIGFSGGRLAYIDSYTTAEQVTPTQLEPADFSYGQDIEDLKELIGPDMEEGTFIPGLTETKIYYSSRGMVILDQGNLTYFQTLGTGDKSYLDSWEKEQEKKEVTPTSAPTAAETKTYSSTDIGFAASYPKEWFLADGVLSSYDTSYLEKGLPLPDKRLKCDFFGYKSEMLRLDNPQDIPDGKVSIKKGIAVDLSGQEGPGLGDSVLYIMEDGKHEPIALLCYSYHTDFEAEVFKMLRTFSFLDK